MPSGTGKVVPGGSRIFPLSLRNSVGGGIGGHLTSVLARCVPRVPGMDLGEWPEIVPAPFPCVGGRPAGSLWGMDDGQWMDRVRACAGELDSLGVDPALSGDECQTILREEGCGRRREIVFAAVALRRGDPVERSQSSASANMRRLERRRERLAAQLDELKAEIERAWLR